MLNGPWFHRCVARSLLTRFRIATIGYFHSLRSREHISIYTLNGDPLFFQHFDGPYYPVLRLLHKCASNSLLCHGICFGYAIQFLFCCVVYLDTWLLID